MKKKILTTKVEEIGERTVRYQISNEVVDRDGDILIANGCDFSNFLKNPVFLPFHRADCFPLGKVISIFIENNAVFADVYFPTVDELATDPTNASENAKLVDFTYHCYKSGMLSAVSVGFIVKKAEPNEYDGSTVLEWELLEFSAVAIPANQEALAQAVKSFGADKANKYFKSTKGADTMDNNENPQATNDEMKALLKACTDEVKSCKKEIESLKTELKECTDEMKAYRKALEDGNEKPNPENPDVQEKPQENPPANDDDEVLEIED